MSKSDTGLAASFAECHKLARLAHSSFVPAFRSLSRDKFQAMEALYAFMRHTDDIVDQPISVSVASEDGWQEMEAFATGQRSSGRFRYDADEPVETDDFGPPPIEGENPYAQTANPEQLARFAELKRWRDALTETVGDPYAPPDTPMPTLDPVAAFPDMPGVQILPAIRDIVTRFHIPKAALFEVLYGVEMDVVPRRFDTFDDTADYCHAVATSVGVASLAIWGTKQPLFSAPVVKAAKACGIAFQWTNFLRDIVEDFHQGRFYFPQDELTRVGLTERQFAELLEIKARPPHGFAALGSAGADDDDILSGFQAKYDRFIERQLDRCETYYMIAANLYDMVSRDARKSFGMMYESYYKLYRKMRTNPNRILQDRVRLSSLGKLVRVLRWTFWPPRTLN